MSDDRDILRRAVLARDILHQAIRIATGGKVVYGDQLVFTQVELLAQNLRGISCP